MILARASLRLNKFPGDILARPPGERAFIYAMVELERQAEQDVIENRNKS